MKGRLEKHSQAEALDDAVALRAQSRHELLERVLKAVRRDGGGESQVAVSAHVKLGVARGALKELIASGRVRKVDRGVAPGWDKPRFVYEATP